MDTKINDDIIEQYYEQSNYAGLDTLYKLIKKSNSHITKNMVKQFLDNQEQEQILKRTIKPKDQGHICALNQFENVQIDLYDLSKYSGSNSNYSYLFAMVDVFTRKLYAVPVKNKTIDSTTKALDKILTGNNFIPHTITSDNDSSFLGHEFQKYLDKHKILLFPNVKDDHFALGIIDNMAKRLKLTFGKIFLKTRSKNWIDYLNRVVKNYNDSPNRSLNGLSPNEVMSNSENEKMIREWNLKKLQKNKTVTDLQIGDNVRIKIKGKFTKSSEPQFSDEVYKVAKVNGRTIELTDGQIKKRRTLLKVPLSTSSTKTTNVITENSKATKTNKILKQVGMQEENIISTKRIKKPNSKYLN